MVHISKTTKDDTSAKEHFFRVEKTYRMPPTPSIYVVVGFGETDLATKSEALGRPEDEQRKMIGIDEGHAHLNSCQEKVEFFKLFLRYSNFLSQPPIFCVLFCFALSCT